MPNTRPLRYRELLRRITKHGVSEKRLGKGSLRMLYKANVEGLNKHVSVHVHGENHEISLHIIKSILRRFKISESSFWNDD